MAARGPVTAAPRAAAPALYAAIAAIALVGVGLSLTVPLIAVRMEAAGYSAQANGASTALAGVATLLVSPMAPTFVRRLGARVTLSGSICVCAVALVALALVDDLDWWFPLRFVFSAALSLVFVVSEYAVSALAPPDRRGFWIGVYSTCLGVGFVLGPVILGLVGADGGAAFFIAAGVCLVAGAPIAFLGGALPGLAHTARVNVFAMMARAPVLMMAALVFGAVETGVMGLLPVHALRNGYDAQTGALFVACIALGNALFQMPIGLVADRMAKPRLLAAIAALGAAGAVALAALTPLPSPFAALLCVWGGVVSGLYMVGLAELGARYDGGELAAANAAFVMFYATGMLGGPPLLGMGVDVSPRFGLFVGLSVALALYFALALGRLREDR